MNNRRKHWEDIYKTKSEKEVSWYEEVPKASLDLIDSLSLKKDAAIIDVGGGNSNLTKELLKQNYCNLTVLDISEYALERTKKKLKSDSEKIKWVHQDVLKFDAVKKYDVWHDRATFHFFTEEEEIEKYLCIAHQALNQNAYMILAEFSVSGPDKCSGLLVRQYSQESLSELLREKFEFIKAKKELHITPSNTKQEFVYSIFKSK